ncbi:MAG TPA: hypothetical protein VK662_11280, partial [Acidothermaceae bacterium]|nr:hypothetical protein [Acidothermaceae bacterium]
MRRVVRASVLRVATLLALLAAAAALPVSASSAASAGPALTVDAAAGRHAISSDIYGMNFAD